jgi:16S rRNA processing protein RimM
MICSCESAQMNTSDKSDPKSRVLLGTIANAHGIRGEVILRTYTSDPEAIAGYGPLSDEAGRRTFKIKSARVTPKGVIARLDGVSDRNAAEALRGVDLYVARARLPKPAEKEFYYADLIGLTARDEAGAEIGWIVNVVNFGAGDLLEIRFNDTKQTDYIPFTDACVPNVDVSGGFVTLVMPEMVGEPEPESGGDATDGADGDAEDATGDGDE